MRSEGNDVVSSPSNKLIQNKGNTHGRTETWLALSDIREDHLHP